MLSCFGSPLPGALKLTVGGEAMQYRREPKRAPSWLLVAFGVQFSVACVHRGAATQPTPPVTVASPPATNNVGSPTGIADSTSIYQDPEQPCPRWACAAAVTRDCYAKLPPNPPQDVVERCIGPAIEQCEKRFMDPRVADHQPAAR